MVSKGLAHGKPAEKECCVICLDNEIDSDLMFPVGRCGHRCFNCVKQHIEVRLLDGTIPNCLHHRCKSKLSIGRCRMLLTLNFSLMWEQRIKEDSTPFNERVYCPYQRCSYLMSKTELSSSVDESGLRRCFKCGGSFCLHCQVPWHSTLTCSQYKSLHPNPQNDDELISMGNRNGWRQCGNCQSMIERKFGCNSIRCRYLSLLNLLCRLKEQTSTIDIKRFCPCGEFDYVWHILNKTKKENLDKKTN